MGFCWLMMNTEDNLSLETVNHYMMEILLKALHAVGSIKFYYLQYLYFSLYLPNDYDDST